MSLATGTQLGPYEIIGALGAGGMGEVYRARDTRLDRVVAIKVLPSHLSTDPEAHERFDREARALSSLNHPNVCTLHDVGHQDGVYFLVMEFLEGQTLGDRLARGPLLFPEALRTAIEICEGLERAHRRGVIHRDLKPGNIMLTKSGAKLMDFGLAKPIVVRTPSGDTETITSPSPTLPVTGEGVVVGTFQYMSPEQVEGKEADERSDIFSLGAVFYEMVTGIRAFSGKSRTAVMAAVLEREPEPISTRNSICPAAFDRAVQLCLLKDKEERWQAVHDLKLELLRIQESLVAGDAIASNKVWWPSARDWTTVWTLVLAAAVAAYFAGRNVASKPEAIPTVRAQLLAPRGFTFSPYMFAISPDGKRLAFVATSDEKPGGVLFVQNLDSPTATPLPGIEEVADSGYPFWSPDSKEIGFFSGGKLKRVSADGGVAVTLADAEDPHGGAWGRDGYVVFSSTGAHLTFDSNSNAPKMIGSPNAELLYRVHATGGSVEAVTGADHEHLLDVHRWPSILPDGHRILYDCYALWEENNANFSGTMARSRGCVADTKRPGQAAAYVGDNGEYANGFLVYGSGEGVLIAQTLDPGKLVLSGEKHPLAPQVMSEETLDTAAFSTSSSGVLAYMAGQDILSQLVWFDRQGRKTGSLGSPGTYDGVAISPDGQQIVTSLADPSGLRCLWKGEASRVILSRFSKQCENGKQPNWSHDGLKIAYSSNNPRGAIYVDPASGVGNGENLFGRVSLGTLNVPTDFTPDGKMLLYINGFGGRGRRLWLHPFGDGQKDHPLHRSDFAEGEANFSPDRHWLAYVSEQNGKPEVNVVQFPNLTNETQVSTGGGSQPRWRRDGKEIFYIAPDGKMMAVSAEANGDVFKAGNPQPLFQTEITSIAHTFYQYDVTADGQNFLINTRTEQPARPITLLINWAAALKR